MSENTELWCCGQLKKIWNKGDHTWEFQGCFSTKEKAIAACKTQNYFIFPIVLDKELPSETVEAPNCEWPLHGEKV